MKEICIKNNNNSYEIININSQFYNYIFNKCLSIFILINSLFTLYLFFQNKKIKSLLNELYGAQYNISNIIKDVEFIENKLINNITIKNSKKDVDMIGLKYPEISFDKIKSDIQNGKIISSFYEFLSQFEEKLLFLEKEINVTKLNAFYTARTIYLQKNGIVYDDSKIKEFHEIMSWLVIHKSTQLKGIASDKYLGCKYAEIKLGKNLCQQRIGVYNNVEEIDFENLTEIGNLILKISNGCHDSVYNLTHYISKLRIILEVTD